MESKDSSSTVRFEPKRVGALVDDDDDDDDVDTELARGIRY